MTKENDKLALVRLDGTGITKSGKEKRTQLFKALAYELDDYSDLSFTPEEAIKISAHISKLQTGSSAMVPMYCGGAEKCPIAKGNACPFVVINQIPLARQCLLEIQLQKHFLTQYIDEYQVDPESLTELGYCNELAEIEIYLWRLNVGLSIPENASLIIKQPVAVDKNGNPVYQDALSPLMEQKEKLQNRRSRIIKLMVGDRQERYKQAAALKQKDNTDSSSRQAETRRKIDNLKRKMDSLKIEDKQLKQKEQQRQPDILTPDQLLDSEM